MVKKAVVTHSQSPNETHDVMAVKSSKESISSCPDRLTFPNAYNFFFRIESEDLNSKD